MSHDHEQTVLESIFCIKAYRESNHKDESRDNITTSMTTLLSCSRLTQVIQNKYMD